MQATQEMAVSGDNFNWAKRGVVERGWVLYSPSIYNSIGFE